MVVKSVCESQMILECDIGNSRCKWRLLSGSKVLRGVFDYRAVGFDPLKELPAVDRVRFCSVSDRQVSVDFKSAIHDLFAVHAEQASVSGGCGGVQVAYNDPSKLGVDRWAAMVAARQQFSGPLLVVDAGSALTVDALTAEGCHLGGLISPGLALMKEALLKDTAKVRFGELQLTGDLGQSTEGAVACGLVSSLVGAVIFVLERAELQLGQACQIVVTGGDADLFTGQLGRQVSLNPELVLDGLQYILP
jgi:type III pantothenate kinase